MKLLRSITNTRDLSQHRSSTEALESRVVPAAVFNFVEGDGDLVTITTSLGTDADLAAAVNLAAGNEYISALDLTAPVFLGSNVRVISEPGGVAGDGFINVGLIDGTNLDLGNVRVDGDLGKILVGNANFGTPGIGNLIVRSLGKFDTSTGAPDLASSISGDAGNIRIFSDVRAASLTVNALGGLGGNIASLFVGGSVFGTVANNSGEITAEGSVGAVTIGGSLVGGDGDDSAKLTVGGSLGLVTIGGSLLGDGERSARIVADSLEGLTIAGSLVGGVRPESGTVQIAGDIGFARIEGSLVGWSGIESGRLQASGDIGPVVIGGDLAGGTGTASGSVISTGGDILRILVRGSVTGDLGSESGKISAQGIGAVRILGDLLGGIADNSGKVSAGTGGIGRVLIGGSAIGGYSSVTGTVFTDGDLGPVRILGDLIGADVNGGADIDATGYLRADNIARVFIGGSIVSGTDTGAGALSKSGSIRAVDQLGPVIVRGGILGNPTQPVVISADGVQGLTADHTAIARVAVAGNAQYLQVLAGYDANGNPTDGDAAIGAVRIGGDARAVDIVAGADSGGDRFGNANDTAIAGLDPAVFSRIGAIVIRGQIVNSTAPADGFGFVAQEIGTLRLGGKLATLTPGASNDVLTLGTVSDLTLREIA